MGARISRLLRPVPKPTPQAQSPSPQYPNQQSSTTTPKCQQHSEEWSKLLRDISGSISSQPWESTLPAGARKGSQDLHGHVARRSQGIVEKLPRKRVSVEGDSGEDGVDEKVVGGGMQGRLTMVRMLDVWKGWREDGLEKAIALGREGGVNERDVRLLVRSARGMLGAPSVTGGMFGWADPGKKVKRFEDLSKSMEGEGNGGRAKVDDEVG